MFAGVLWVSVFFEHISQSLNIIHKWSLKFIFKDWKAYHSIITVCFLSYHAALLQTLDASHWLNTKPFMMVLDVFE